MNLIKRMELIPKPFLTIPISINTNLINRMKLKLLIISCCISVASIGTIVAWACGNCGFGPNNIFSHCPGAGFQCTTVVHWFNQLCDRPRSYSERGQGCEWEEFDPAEEAFRIVINGVCTIMNTQPPSWQCVGEATGGFVTYLGRYVDCNCGTHETLRSASAQRVF
jgi:hypothetical protein